MGIRSLRLKVFVLLAFLGVPVFFVVFNLVLARHQACSAQLQSEMAVTERRFLGRVVGEAAQLAARVLQRDRLFADLVATTGQSRRLFRETEDRLMDLARSVRYIHEQTVTGSQYVPSLRTHRTGSRIQQAGRCDDPGYVFPILSV